MFFLKLPVLRERKPIKGDRKLLFKKKTNSSWHFLQEKPVLEQRAWEVVAEQPQSPEAGASLRNSVSHPQMSLNSKAPPWGSPPGVRVGPRTLGDESPVWAGDSWACQPPDAIGRDRAGPEDAEMLTLGPESLGPVLALARSWGEGWRVC